MPFDGSSRLGLELETVIDRTAYGLNWNAPLPTGGFAVGNDVKLYAELELVLARSLDADPGHRRQPARGLVQSSSSCSLAAENLPDGVELAVWEGLRDLPAFDEDAEEHTFTRSRGLPLGGRGRRRCPDRDPRVQRLDPGCAQERARLGVEAAGNEPVPGQARRGDRREPRLVRGRLGARRGPQGARADGLSRRRGGALARQGARSPRGAGRGAPRAAARCDRLSSSDEAAARAAAA